MLIGIFIAMLLHGVFICIANTHDNSVSNLTSVLRSTARIFGVLEVMVSIGALIGMVVQGAWS